MTKADRLKLARKAKGSMGIFLLFQKPHVREGHGAARADEIGYQALLDARAHLDELIRVEAAALRLHGAEQANVKLTGMPDLR